MVGNNDYRNIVKQIKEYLCYLEDMGIREIQYKKSEVRGRKSEDLTETIGTGLNIRNLNIESGVLSLESIKEELGYCKRCNLYKTRTNIVFGVGNPNAKLIFVGEGPGEDEDLQGEPFVGKAGQLLTKIIEAMGLNRQDVYICNVVKCRPPQNRNPEHDEISACKPFLEKQIDTIKPQIIVALGNHAAQTILNTDRGITKIRGQFFYYRDNIKVMPTYHPSYLLRNESKKKEVWEDMQKVMAELGLEKKAKD
ncbi:MAG: uracil-DNA glycosylase [Deltaproteobacteria bacterium]|nr:uracil-DNA glycosylase [Deltaproteobacteria bacterium]